GELAPGRMGARGDHVRERLRRAAPGLEAAQADHAEGRVGARLGQHDAMPRGDEGTAAARRHARRREGAAELASAMAETGNRKGHGLILYCSTAEEAAFSSINPPVRKRSSENLALSGCGSLRAIVWAKTQPEAGVDLKPPVPQ